MEGSLDIESLVCELYPPDNQERVFQDIRNALEKYPYLVAEQSETVSSQHGNVERALSLCGPVCVNHASTTYFVPIDLFIPPVYPAVPPICYVRPAKGTILVKSHKYMNAEGLCTSAIIQHWRPSSNFSQFIDSLVQIFKIEPPVQEAPPEELQKSSVSSPGPIIELEAFTSDCNSYQPTKEAQLEQKLKETYRQFSVSANESIDNLLREGESLHSHSTRLDTFINAVDHDIERQKQCMRVFADKIQGLHEWINFETKEQSTRSIDDMIQCNELDEQLLDAIADDASYEDCLFVLRQELHRNNIDFETFTKQIRALGRKQFFARALANKIVASHIRSPQNSKK